MPADDGLVESLDEYAHPLDRTAPGEGLADLRPLAEVFEGRPVVGLGEATHGTREFFQLKHRLVRLLVTELDFRLFGLEANFSEALAVNDYVLRGEGDPADALAGLRFWTWHTEEMLALVEWLREYNEGRSADDRVRFYGFDAQFARGPAAAIEAFFERVDPDYLSAIGDELDVLKSDPPRTDHDARKEWLVTAETVVEDVSERLRTRRDEYRSETTDREWRTVRRHRRTLEQAFELAVARTFEDERPNAVRDANMAENVEWILDHEGADRIALWAHNGHVKTGRFPGGDAPKTMGAHLRDAFGDDYYALGFEFGRGTFQAYPNPEAAGELTVRSFSLRTIPDDAVAAVLDDLDRSLYHLDVPSATDDPTAHEWLEAERRLHSVGSVYAEDVDGFETVELAAEFDGLVYVAETNRAVPLEN